MDTRLENDATSEEKRKEGMCDVILYFDVSFIFQSDEIQEMGMRLFAIIRSCLTIIINYYVNDELLCLLCLQCRWSSSVESKMIQDDAYITVLEMKWK